MSKYIEFVPVPVERKTKMWSVVTVAYGPFRLGTVQWFTRWRKYAFFPIAETVYEQQCLRDIADFCESETKKHRDRSTG